MAFPHPFVWRNEIPLSLGKKLWPRTSASFFHWAVEISFLHTKWCGNAPFIRPNFPYNKEEQSIKDFSKKFHIFNRFFFTQKPLKRTSFKTIFEYKMTFWICVPVLWIHKVYFIVKTWYEMSVLKLFNTKRYLIITSLWSSILIFRKPRTQSTKPAIN